MGCIGWFLNLFLMLLGGVFLAFVIVPLLGLAGTAQGWVITFVGSFVIFVLIRVLFWLRQHE